MFSSSTRARPRRARSFLGRARRSSPWRRRSSRKSFLKRAGSSMIRSRSGEPRSRQRGRLCPGRESSPARSPDSGSPTSARRRSSGAGRLAGRSTMRSSGRIAGRRPLRRTQGARMRDARVQARGLAARSLFLGDEDRLDSRQCSRRTRGSRTRRAGLRHRRQLSRLAPDQRQGSRHRRHQRLEDAPVQYPLGRMG